MSRSLIFLFVVCMAACGLAQTTSGNTSDPFIKSGAKFAPRDLPTVVVTDPKRIATGEWQVLSRAMAVTEKGPDLNVWEIVLIRKSPRPDGVWEKVGIIFDQSVRKAGEKEHLYRMMNAGTTVWFVPFGHDLEGRIWKGIAEHARMPGVTGPTENLIPSFGQRPKDK